MNFDEDDIVSIELEFAPDLLLVSRIREFATSFFQEMLTDSEALSRVAVTTHEILENAVKYSIDGRSRLRLDYEESTGKIMIRAWNRPRPEHLEHLKRRLRDLHDSDPTDIYLSLMADTVTRTEGSGLGLGRIRAEADFQLRYETDGQMLCVIAESQAQLQHQS